MFFPLKAVDRNPTGEYFIIRFVMFSGVVVNGNRMSTAAPAAPPFRLI